MVAIITTFLILIGFMATIISLLYKSIMMWTQVTFPFLLFDYNESSQICLGLHILFQSTLAL